MGSHYSLGQNPKSLLRWAAMVGERLTQADLLDTGDDPEYGKSPILVYRGMSGVAHSTALALHLQGMGIECGMVYVRKPEEQAHGSSIETNFPERVGNNTEGSILVFVDDFISGGDTMRACLNAVIKKENETNVRRRDSTNPFIKKFLPLNVDRQYYIKAVGLASGIGERCGKVNINSDEKLTPFNPLHRAME